MIFKLSYLNGDITLLKLQYSKKNKLVGIHCKHPDPRYLEWGQDAEKKRKTLALLWDMFASGTIEAGNSEIKYKIKYDGFADETSLSTLCPDC